MTQNKSQHKIVVNYNFTVLDISYFRDILVILEVYECFSHFGCFQEYFGCFRDFLGILEVLGYFDNFTSVFLILDVFKGILFVLEIFLGILDHFRDFGVFWLF